MLGCIEGEIVSRRRREGARRLAQKKIAGEFGITIGK
jgi:hypothetical protein